MSVVPHQSRATSPLTFALALCSAFVVLAAIAPVASAGTVGVTGRIQGAGSITSSSGGPYSCFATSNQDERNTVTCQREAFGAVFNASVTLVPTPSSFPAGQWSFVGWQGCDSVSGTSCTVSSGPFTLDEKSPKAIFNDVAAPTVSSDGESFGDRSATFFFHANEPSNWFCRLDSGALETCGSNTSLPSGKSYSSLSEGVHSFSVQAFDPSGQGSTTLQRSVTIVDTAITGGPAALVKTQTATFTYSTVRERIRVLG